MKSLVISSCSLYHGLVVSMLKESFTEARSGRSMNISCNNSVVLR